VAYTAVELALPWLFLSRAEQHLTSSTAGLLIATVPLVAVVLYRLVSPDTERLSPRRLLGLVVGFAGVGALVGIDLNGTDLAAVAEVAVPAVVYAPAALTHWPTHVTLEVFGAVAGLAFGCTALAFLLFFALIAEIGPARSTVITYLNPAVAVLLGVVLLGEPFTTGIAVGFPLILVGSVLATRSRRDVQPTRSVLR
jgi:drug/metabolite transporter (DMT)-like permease